MCFDPTAYFKGFAGNPRVFRSLPMLELMCQTWLPLLVCSLAEVSPVTGGPGRAGACTRKEDQEAAWLVPTCVYSVEFSGLNTRQLGLSFVYSFRGIFVLTLAVVSAVAGVVLLLFF